MAGLIHLPTFFAYAGISTPSFWLAIVLIIIFSVGLQWLPAGGTNTVGVEFTFMEFLVDRIKHLILPVMSFDFFLQTGVFVSLC